MFLFKPYYIMYYVIGIYIAVLTVYSLYLFVFPTGAHYTTGCVDNGLVEYSFKCIFDQLKWLQLIKRSSFEDTFDITV